MHLLPHLPAPAILDAYATAPGRELGGKGDSPESSSALVANAFGYFIDKAALLPALPGLEGAGWPASRVAIEANVRFPWSGGRHPWLDALVETNTHTIGVESKRFEPYRSPHVPHFSDAYSRDVWSSGMTPYLKLMTQLREGRRDLSAIDATQLIKHALALSTQCSKSGKQPVLYYLYADPPSWPDGRAITDAQRNRHAEHIDAFAQAVAGAHVNFVAATYAQVFETWARAIPEVVRHTRSVAHHFAMRAAG